MAWFIERFGGGGVEDDTEDEESKEEEESTNDEDDSKFDVVIMDALDPQNAVEIVKHLYGDQAALEIRVQDRRTDHSVQGHFLVQE
eukprot:CAMPEP_0113480148 /NCGR_PEP_ID=MMETSP0014_2-20120614/21714_1 /TAXON_ID=2857 /ORGANISM="Nitzschia sp." /LENGTH=85 /DNA_ID=CAMNT_0000373545 /DNA_START=639 /DNA_END=895 /DNA_ORIENTATION=- /assembly_acc=CAM_ASM_000159